MGTSLTAKGAWGGLLGSWLKSESPNASQVSLTNYAVSGSSSDNPQTLFSGIKNQLPKVLNANPDVVIIEFGMNDAVIKPTGGYYMTLEDSKANLHTIIEALIARNPSVTIILQTMNNAAGADGSTKRPLLEDFYEVTRQVAQAHHTLLVDHYPNWKTLFDNDPTKWRSYMTDNVHPNATGSEMIILPQLKQSLIAELTPEGFEGLNQANAFSDADGDGVSLVDELLFGGDPLIADKVMTIQFGGFETGGVLLATDDRLLIDSSSTYPVFTTRVRRLRLGIEISLKGTMDLSFSENSKYRVVEIGDVQGDGDFDLYRLLVLGSTGTLPPAQSFIHWEYDLSGLPLGAAAP